MKRGIIQLAAVIILLILAGCAGEPGRDNAYDPNNDIVRPAVVEVTPADGEKAVLPGSVITVKISEELDTLSITLDNVVLQEGTNVLAGVLYYADRTITFIPARRLKSSQAYTLILTDQIRDLAGNRLEKNYMVNFSTKIGNAPRMAYITGGTFTMGSPNLYSDNRPAHQVKLNSFYMGKTEVTFEQFDEYCESAGLEKPQSSFGRGLMPVVNITWNDAIDYCNWLSDMCGLERCYTRNGGDVTWDPEKNGYRLPTEAEWEYAAREGGCTDPDQYSGYWPGVTDVNDFAWYQANSGGGTHEAGTLNPNQLGLYDMSGNVREYCWDWYSATYYQDCYSQGTVVNPRGPAYVRYVTVRGGEWDSSTIATAYRSYNSTFTWQNNRGFRVCRNE
jgi:formylglycine-generating enzyme required for sulfatase activity